jgi:uncharacterized protein (TIGR02145 family)
MNRFRCTLISLLVLGGFISNAQNGLTVHSGGRLTVNGNTNIIQPVFTCGNPFVDVRDMKIYKTVLIGSQCWMAQNLNYGTRVNGSLDQTNNGITEKYCYNDLESNCDVYGGLYQWFEQMNYSPSSTSNPSGVQGICPAGWHVPSNTEFCQLLNFLGEPYGCEGGWSQTETGGKLKEAGTTHWAAPNTGADNSSGFTALPAGARNYNGSAFIALSQAGVFWTSYFHSYGTAWYLGLYSDNAHFLQFNTDLNQGHSVRCVKD